MKKTLSVILTVIMCIFTLSSCGKEEAEAETPVYTGILTKVKLGMPLTKVVSMQPDGVELYYEDDTTIWSVNPDTDLMEVRDLIPVDDLYYYADDSIITYKFRTVKGDDEIYLKGYTEEVHCLMDRAAAEEYFGKKTDELVNKHCLDEGSGAIGTMVGTEGVDMELVYTQNISASSYDVVFSMTLTYDTVNSADGYYATKFDISLTEKEVKNSVPITTTAKSKSNDKDEKAEDSEEKEEE